MPPSNMRRNPGFTRPQCQEHSCTTCQPRTAMRQEVTNYYSRRFWGDTVRCAHAVPALCKKSAVFHHR